MTRLEEIVQEAKHHEREEGFTQLVKDTKGLYSAYGIGFLEGAEWADKSMIDKACEWLESVNLDYYQIREGVFSKELVADFRKAMGNEL